MALPLFGTQKLLCIFILVSTCMCLSTQGDYKYLLNE